VEGFELVAADLADNYSTLVLTFSNPVGPLAGVAPTDFRLSLALTERWINETYDGTYEYQLSDYYEPNRFQGYNDGTRSKWWRSLSRSGPPPRWIRRRDYSRPKVGREFLFQLVEQALPGLGERGIDGFGGREAA
jgi:hypothetical protein